MPRAATAVRRPIPRSAPVAVEMVSRIAAASPNRTISRASTLTPSPYASLAKIAISPKPTAERRQKNEPTHPWWRPEPFRSIATSWRISFRYHEQMLDLHRLRLLREVHARGTVHAAAAALGYSTSAVSQQL